MVDEHDTVVVDGGGGGSGVGLIVGIIVAAIIILALIWWFAFAGHPSGTQNININPPQPPAVTAPPASY